MNNKNFIKSLLDGVLSLGTIVPVASKRILIDINEPIFKLTKNKAKIIRTDLKPISSEIGACFDEAGSFMLGAMNVVSVK